MDWIKKTRKAFDHVRKNYKTQVKLAEDIGVQQSQISALISGKKDFSQLYFGSVLKLFPEIEISYFCDERPSDDAMDIAYGYDELSLERKEKVMRTFKEEYREQQKERRLREQDPSSTGAVKFGDGARTAGVA